VAQTGYAYDAAWAAIERRARLGGFPFLSKAVRPSIVPRDVHQAYHRADLRNHEGILPVAQPHDIEVASAESETRGEEHRISNLRDSPY
jgi:hypothetical protein